MGRRPDLAEAEPITGSSARHLDDVRQAASPAATRRATRELASSLSELRLIKDDWEVDELQLAVDPTTSGFEDVVRALPPP